MKYLMFNIMSDIYVESKKPKSMNKQTETNSKYKDQTDGSQMEGGLEDWVQNRRGVKKYRLIVTK